MAVVSKGRIDFLQDSATLNKDMVLVVNQDVGDAGICQQRLQRPQTEDFIQEFGFDLCLFRKVQRHSLCDDDLTDHPCNGLPCLTRVDAGELLQIQLGDERLMYLRFELVDIQSIHIAPSSAVYLPSR